MSKSEFFSFRKIKLECGQLNIVEERPNVKWFCFSAVLTVHVHGQEVSFKKSSFKKLFHFFYKQGSSASLKAELFCADSALNITNSGRFSASLSFIHPFNESIISSLSSLCSCVPNEWCRKSKESRLQTVFSVLIFQISISHLKCMWKFKTYTISSSFPLTVTPYQYSLLWFLPLLTSVLCIAVVESEPCWILCGN